MVSGEFEAKVMRASRISTRLKVRAREIAINERSEVVIHRPDGRIRDKDSYGNDPNPPRDRKY